jgi:hypothetical protein
MINRQPRGLEARPAPFLGHRGNVEHLNFPIGEIAGGEFSAFDKQARDDLPGQKGGV